jgi:phosphosulfolactate phosphohydrolase-like enzyme
MSVGFDSLLIKKDLEICSKKDSLYGAPALNPEKIQKNEKTISD